MRRIERQGESLPIKETSAFMKFIAGLRGSTWKPQSFRGDFLPHRLQQRQTQRDASQTFQYRTTIKWDYG